MGINRKEYLQRPLIEGVVYEITDNLIRVTRADETHSEKMTMTRRGRNPNRDKRTV